MALQNLPAELLDNVLRNVTPVSLAIVAQTCSTLHAVAQRLLYRHLCISPFNRNISVVSMLASKPEIARMVRSFSISFHEHNSSVQPFYSILASALACMSELTSLDLLIHSDASWVLNGIVTLYPSLSHFSCSLPFDSHVAAFLSKTPTLLHLEVGSAPCLHPRPLPPLPPSFLPRLTHFVGSSQVASIIVPGRPIENVQLFLGDLNEEDILCLSSGTARIALLSATTSYLPIPFLDLLARHLPHLVYLRIMTTYNFDKAPDVEFYEGIADRLAKLPDLNAFELSGMSWGSRRKIEDGNKRIWQSSPLDRTSVQHGASDSGIAAY